MKKTDAIKWLLQFHTKMNTKFWYGQTFDTNEDCLKAIKKDLKSKSQDEINEIMSQYGC